MNQKDIKILWGRSGNRCSICKCLLTQDKEAATESLLIGEHAHIVGDKENSARWNSILTPEERDGYSNRTLVCSNCHTVIDKNEDDWPVDKLHFEKDKHEQWVIDTLSETINHVKLAHSVASAILVDDTVRLCRLELWQEWSQCALSPTPWWFDDHIDDVNAFHQRVLAMIWAPNTDELQASIRLLSHKLHIAIEGFLRHAELVDNRWVAIRFYKAMKNNPNYDREVEEYNAWIQECFKNLHECTKAVNWFADVVRKDINPMFFVESGRFLMESGPYHDLNNKVHLALFTETEINEYIRKFVLK